MFILFYSFIVPQKLQQNLRTHELTVWFSVFHHWWTSSDTFYYEFFRRHWFVMVFHNRKMSQSNWLHNKMCLPLLGKQCNKFTDCSDLQSFKNILKTFSSLSVFLRRLLNIRSNGTLPGQHVWFVKKKYEMLLSYDTTIFDFIPTDILVS